MVLTDAQVRVWCGNTQTADDAIVISHQCSFHVFGRQLSGARVFDSGNRRHTILH